MPERHHYIAQFHLRGFVDIASEATPDPWLWIGNLSTGEVKRRAPRNFAYERGLYTVPGGQRDQSKTLESLLAEKVEAPAATALREYLSRPKGKRGSAPAAVMRYLSWAAARTPAMRELYQEWIDTFPLESPDLESPPDWTNRISKRERPSTMSHPVHGRRDDVPTGTVQRLISEGWRFVVTEEDFGEMVHLQAAYLASHHFPRLSWAILDAPSGEEFIIGDRPVVWGFSDQLRVTPAALASPAVQLFAPLNRKVALIGVGPSGKMPRAVSVADINRVCTLAAREWIAGSSATLIASSLRAAQ